MNRSTIAVLGLATLLTACSLSPDYQRPPVPLPAAFPGAAGRADDASGAAADIGWRQFFPDRRLQDLIASALGQNRDLRRAVLDIEQARALYDIRVAERSPEVAATSRVARSRTPAALSRTGSAVTLTQYEVGVALSSWELDLFGRLRSLSDAALAEFEATIEARRAVQIRLVAEVARAYLAERAFAEQLELAQRNLHARLESSRLVEQRVEGGVSSILDLRQAEVLVQSARVAVAVLERQRAQARNALELLVGQVPESLPAPRELAQQDIVAELPPGLPSMLLVRRPDVRAAEQRLIAANANIGAARAAFFPRIALTGSVGTASRELTGLVGAGSTAWSFVPQITLPIFDSARIERNLDLAEVRRNLAVVDYERTIQQAFREVADALVARDALDEQLDAQALLLRAQADRVDIAEQRYRGGVASYLEVLDARRDLFDGEQALVQARQLRLTNAIELYRALGGGLQQ